MKQNAIIYIRVSTAEQVTNFSLPTQEKTCRQYCADNDLVVTRVFCDAGESAKTTDRTEFKKMLAYCCDKKSEVSGDHNLVSGGELCQNSSLLPKTIRIDGRSSVLL